MKGLELFSLKGKSLETTNVIVVERRCLVPALPCPACKDSDFPNDFDVSGLD